MTDTPLSSPASRHKAPARPASVQGFLHSEIVRLRQLGRLRASESCRSTLHALTAFRGGRELSFPQLDDRLMEQFEAYLRHRGLMRNTTSFYMRCLRSVYHRAIERGLTQDLRPFRHVYTSKDKTVKRALCRQDLQAIKRLDLSRRPALDLTRDIFLFSFYTRGMAFVDMAYLRKQDLQSGVLNYRRKKTGQLLSIQWMPCMQQIIDKYPANPTPYLLPLITDPAKDTRRQYQSQMRRINRNLKRVAQMANIDVPLSSYFARHSWASLAHEMNIPLAVISEGLGHDNEATTQIYLNQIQSTVVNEANRKLLDLL